MDPRRITNMIRQAGVQAALRAGKTGTKLLDDSENNVGNGTIVQPQSLNPGINFTTLLPPTANNSRLLNLTAESNKSQSVTVVMTAAATQASQKYSGPLTGIIEFGNGTQNTTISFDIPFGPYIGDDFGNILPGTQPEDSGAIIQLPTSIVRAYARYDNAFVQPTITGPAFGGPRISPSGPDGPSFPLGAGAGPFSPNDATGQFVAPLIVKAFVAYFGRIHNKLYKTQYLYCGNVVAKVSFAGAGNSPVLYCIPPFAKSVRLIRNPISAAMVVELVNETKIASGDRTDAHYEIVANAMSPIIPIEGNSNLIRVGSLTAGAGDKVSDVRLVYEIAF
jgi:hypothetical protein